MASSRNNAIGVSPADSSRAVAGQSTRPTSLESDANRPATGSPVRAGSSRIQDWIARQQLCRNLSKNSEPLEGSCLPRVSPWGAIGTPVTRPVATRPPPVSGLNPGAKAFKPGSKTSKPKPVAPLPAPPPPGLNVNAAVFHLPGSDILEQSLLVQFPPYQIRREMHNSNHRQWSRMLTSMQRANPNSAGAIQQFAESEKQRYKEMM